MNWVGNNLDLIGQLTLVHLCQSLIALVVGFVISIPLGWVAWRYRLVRSGVITITGLLYTIPSLALQPDQLFLQLRAHDGVDRAEGLVHQQDVRVGREAACDSHTLLLTARELTRVAVRQ